MLQCMSDSLSSSRKSLSCAHKLWKTRPCLLWHLWLACMGVPPKAHPSMAQVVACGSFFAIGGGSLLFPIAGGGSFRAGFFFSESKILRCVAAFLRWSCLQSYVANQSGGAQIIDCHPFPLHHLLLGDAPMQLVARQLVLSTLDPVVPDFAQLQKHLQKHPLHRCCSGCHAGSCLAASQSVSSDGLGAMISPLFLTPRLVRSELVPIGSFT